MRGFNNDLKLANLQQLNELVKVKFIYKHKHQKLPSSFNSFLTSNTAHGRYALRSLETHDFKCIWGKTHFGMKMLQYEGARLWNAIPTDIRRANSLRDFVKKFKTTFSD